MPGLQTDPAECDTIVAGVVITPTPTPVAAPTVVAGTQVSSQPLPVTGADTRGMAAAGILLILGGARSEEHTSELQSLMRNSYAVFCLKKKNKTTNDNTTH